MTVRATLVAASLLSWSAALIVACVTTPGRIRASGDGLDVGSLPPEIRADYQLFAQRCSRCHSLGRALDNGHIEDRFWAHYVERMRHQPGSGIAPEDVPGILRFLHYYSTEIVAAEGKSAAAAQESDGPR